MTTFPELASYRPLESTQRQPRMARHDVVCLHTMVGSLTGTDRMFKANGWGGTESHFGIGGKWGDGLDGRVYQWQDTEYTADANLDGNHRVLSIETGDNAPRSAADIAPWTPKQLDAIVALTAALCRRYDIPAVLIPDTRSNRRGIAYHRQGVQHSGGTHPAGFLQPGCERWSSSVGKECPGTARIAQLPGIVARVRATLAGTVITKEVQQVELSDKVKLTEAAARNYSQPGYTPRKEGDQLSVNYLMQWGGPGLYRLLGKVDALQAQNAGLAVQVKALTAAVAALAGNSPEAIQSAFSAGVTELKAELAQIDVRVTLGQDDTTDDTEV